MDLRNFSDNELLKRTETLVKREREVLTDTLHHLREIERYRLFCDLGYSSLFSYCVGELKYSESQAQRRIEAMRLMKELPQIEEKVAAGELSLTNLALAQKHFCQEEKVVPVSLQKKIEVLKKLENKTSREGEKILLADASMPPAPVKEKIQQITAEITELKFGVDEKLLAKINRLKGLVAHRKANMSLQEFMNELCEIALEKLDPVRKSQRSSQPQSHSHSHQTSKAVAGAKEFAPPPKEKLPDVIPSAPTMLLGLRN